MLAGELQFREFFAAEFGRLRVRVIDDLQAAGLSDLVPRVDDNLFVVTVDERLRRPTRDRLVRMFDLGLPTAVFVMAV